MKTGQCMKNTAKTINVSSFKFVLTLTCITLRCKTFKCLVWKIQETKHRNEGNLIFTFRKNKKNSKKLRKTYFSNLQERT